MIIQMYIGLWASIQSTSTVLSIIHINPKFHFQYVNLHTYIHAYNNKEGNKIRMDACMLPW